MQIFTNNYKIGEDLSKITGERIKRTLRYRGITQKEFFEGILGEKKTTYSKWLSGENKIPVEKLILIAKELNCTTDFLLGLRPTADRAGEGIGSLLHYMGYSVDFPNEFEDQIVITKNDLSFTCNRNELIERINHILSYEIYTEEEKANVRNKKRD